MADNQIAITGPQIFSFSATTMQAIVVAGDYDLSGSYRGYGVMLEAEEFRFLEDCFVRLSLDEIGATCPNQK